jgi:hypothetical protein
MHHAAARKPVHRMPSGRCLTAKVESGRERYKGTKKIKRVKNFGISMLNRAATITKLSERKLALN